MSSLKRTPINRHRKPLIDDETLQLFIRLESMGLDEAELRGTDEVKRLDRQLHERLGLGGEWFCSIVSVLDRRAESHRPGSPQNIDFQRVRGVRLQLLAEAARRGVVFALDRRKRRRAEDGPAPTPGGGLA